MTKEQESELLKNLMEMAMESLSPDVFVSLEEAVLKLKKTRKIDGMSW